MRKEKTKMSSMDPSRESLLKTIEDNLSTMFVEKYDEINIARNSVNAYLKDIEIDYIYDYNSFCVDFMVNTKNLVHNVAIEKLRELDSSGFVSEVLSFMIKNKIYEKVEEPNRRAYLMIQHELKKFLINR